MIPPDHDVKLWAAARCDCPPGAVLEVRLGIDSDDDYGRVPCVLITHLDLNGRRTTTCVDLHWTYDLTVLVDDIRTTATAARATAYHRDHPPTRRGTR